MLAKSKRHIKTCFFILLFLFGMREAVDAQKIVIHDSDSSWMGKEIPAKALVKKNFSFIRRWFQNTTTRYNYFFNSNETFQKAIAQAEDIHTDNYDSILTLYPYQPKDFEVLGSRLDSVITNAGIGIEVHDPRSKWVRQSYLLLGKAQFYKQNYTEAIHVFRYMIRNMSRKDKEDRPKIIGSREYHPEENISVMTPENKKKKFPPARNDAFIWLIRTYFQQKNQDKVSPLLSAIEADPNLPDRLLGELNIIKTEFYTRRDKTSAATDALVSAISLQSDKRLQARWQFILSQLYNKKGSWKEAIASYHKVADYKPKPIMKLYAALRPVLIEAAHSSSHYAETKKKIFHIAEKRKFSHFKSIIYLHLGKLALQSGHPADGISYLKKSLSYQEENKKTHTKSSLLLANYYYQKHQYPLAKKYYDKATNATAGYTLIRKRKEALTKIVKNIHIINREDSLQKLSKIPQDSLYALLHKKVEDSLRNRKKQNLIMEDKNRHQKSLITKQNEKDNLQDENEYEGTKWYFYNENVKARGYNKFKARWGKRSLGDNWRTSEPHAPSEPKPTTSVPNLTKAPSDKNENQGATNTFAKKYFQKLLTPIPLEEESFNASVKRETEAYHKNINTFYITLKDDSATLFILQQLLHKFPENNYLPDIYYKLYLIYKDRGVKNKMTFFKQKILSTYPDSKYAKLFQPKKERDKEQLMQQQTEQLYNIAYNSYVAGDYKPVSRLRDSALKINKHNKQKARFDLLNAMTLVKTDTGEAGITALQQVIKDYPSDSPIIQRSRQIIYNIQHKDTLIAHLKSIKFKKQKKATVQQLTKKESPATPPIPPIENKKTPSKKREIPRQTVPDSIRKMATKKKKMSPYRIERKVPYFVILYFHKKDASLLKKVTTSFNKYNKKFYVSDSIQISPYLLSQKQLTLIFRTFKNEKEALSYYQNIKKDIPFNILPDVPSSYYQLFFMTINNFVLMKDTKDLKGYLTFFYKHYK